MWKMLTLSLVIRRGKTGLDLCFAVLKDSLICNPVQLEINIGNDQLDGAKAT